MSVVSAVDCIFSFTIAQKASQMKRSKLPYSKNKKSSSALRFDLVSNKFIYPEYVKIRDPFPNKTKDKLKKANRVRFSFSGLWSPYVIFLGQTIIFTLSLVTKILVGYKSYLQKCLFLISRVI